MSKDKQLRAFVQKQKNLICEAENEREESIAYAMWATFINGLRMLGVISNEEYQSLFSEIEEFRRRSA